MSATSSALQPAPATILYVEDDKNAAAIFRLVVDEMALKVSLVIVENGGHVMRFLNREEPYVGAPRPALLILDINLPGESGFDVLKRIRKRPDLKELPAMFFTTAALEKDRGRSVRLGALALVHKPVELEKYEQAVRSMLCQVPGIC